MIFIMQFTNFYSTEGRYYYYYYYYCVLYVNVQLIQSVTRICISTIGCIVYIQY
jgi:hypothetical protein